MKLLRRNTKYFEYYPYTGTETDLNSDGEHTGEYYPVYEASDGYRGNISAPNGQTNQTFYGEDIRYTHTLVMDKPDYDIRENGLILYDGKWYDIVSVHPSLNALSIALRRRTEDNVPIVPDEPVEPIEPGDEPIEPVEPGDEPVEPVEPGDEPGEPVEPGDEPGEPGEPGDEPGEPGGGPSEEETGGDSE